MTLQINGNNIKITPQLEDFAHKKLDRLDRYLPHISNIRLDLTHKNTRRGEDRIIAQITVRHERGAILRSEVKHFGDVEPAIDLATEKMFKQIMRFKGKRHPKGRERFSATLEELALAEPLPELDVDGAQIDYAGIEAAQADATVVRRKEIFVSPMSEEEAIDQMELLGHTFFIFRDAKTNVISVVYRREDDQYGVLIAQGSA